MSPACEELALLGHITDSQGAGEHIPSHFPDTRLKEPGFFDAVSFFTLFHTLEEKRLNM